MIKKLMKVIIDPFSHSQFFFKSSRQYVTFIKKTQSRCILLDLRKGLIMIFTEVFDTFVLLAGDEQVTRRTLEKKSDDGVISVKSLRKSNKLFPIYLGTDKKFSHQQEFSQYSK